MNRIGEVFGRLTVIARAPDRVYKNGKRYARWTCRCKCGKETESSTGNLTRGHTKSCGCYRAEKPSKDFKTHGKTRTRIYSVWKAMRRRCEAPQDPSFERYGKQGIQVCARWQKFENFFADMGEPPPGTSIDRYPDNKGNYEPGNCRWATSTEQNRNRSNNVKVSVGSKTLLIPEWAAISGVKTATIRRRIEAGMSLEDSIFKPTRKHQ